MEKSQAYFWIIALSSKALSEYSEIKPYLVCSSHNLDFEGENVS